MKPGDLLVGVMDFFAILLPGSLATWLVIQYVPEGELARALTFGIEGARGAPHPVVLGTAFLLSSYVLGHFVFMAGSRLDPLYDCWRKSAKPKQRDKTFQAARRLHKQLTRDLVGGEFSTLKWAKTYVQVQAPQGRTEIDRLEADSKFFRSLVVVAVALGAHFVWLEPAAVVGVGALALTRLSYVRYRDQRWKMTELSYATAVIAHAVREPVIAVSAAGAPKPGREDPE